MDWSKTAMPKNVAIVRATGDTRIPDPTQTAGPVQLMAKREEDGTYNLLMWIGWDSAFSYAERGFGSVIDHPSLWGLTTHDMMYGAAKVGLTELTEKLLKASKEDVKKGKSGALANIAKLVTLGGDMVTSLNGNMMRESLASYEKLDLDLEEWLKFILKVKTKFRRLIKHSLADDSFSWSPIGLRVNTFTPATETIFDDGTKSPPRWLFDMPDNPLEEFKHRRAMVGIWYIIRGIFGVKLTEYDSIVLSFMFEKFKRQPMQLETSNISQLIYHYMPQILRPGFLDLKNAKEQARAIAYMIALTMMCNRFSEVGLSTLVHPVHWTALKIGQQPDQELISTWNYGRFRPEPEFGSGECTFIKPSRGVVTGWAMMRNTGRNHIQLKLKRNARHINSTPQIQFSDVLALSDTPDLDSYTIIGFGFRGQVIHVYSEDESNTKSLLRIVDTALRPSVDDEYDPDADVHGVIANLLIGAVPLFKNTTGTFLSNILIGEDGNSFSMEKIEEPNASKSVDLEEISDVILTEVEQKTE